MVGKAAHEEDVAAVKDESAEKRELNADALVVIEEVKKDALVEEEKEEVVPCLPENRPT